MGITPEIYVADLAAYSAGRLRGEWIDATQSKAEIKSDIQAMLDKSTEPIAESWAIHDYSNFGGAGHHLGEHPNLDDLVRFVELLHEYKEVAVLVLSYYCGCLEDTEEALNVRYCGEFDSLGDYAESLWESSIRELPEELTRYIDFEKMGYELELGGEIFTVKSSDSKVHIFNNRPLQ